MATYIVSAGGTATYIEVPVGPMVMSAVQVSTPVTLGPGDNEDVYGTGISATVIGGDEAVFSGGTEIDSTLSGSESKAGAEDINSGGTASGVTLYDGGIQVVNSGATATSTTINNSEDADSQYVYAGTSIDTVVNSGDEGVYGGGLAIGTTVNSGYEGVNGSTASDTTVNSGGSQLVDGFTGNSHGITISTTVNSGGSEYVYSGGTANSTILNGGTETVVSGGTVSGIVVNSGGLLDVQSASTVNGAINFGTSGGTVEIEDTNIPISSFTGVGAGDTIDFRNVAYMSGASATFSEINNVPLVAVGGSTYSLQFNPDQQSLSDGFTLSNDGFGGTDIEAISPYYGVVYITDSQGGGTGFIIGPHTILTAAHVLEDSSGIASSVGVAPGYSGGTPPSSLYPAVGIQIDPSYSVPPALQNINQFEQNEQFDFAVVNVAADLSSYGIFGLQSYYSAGTVNLTGYPEAYPGDTAAYQVNDIGGVVADLTYNLLDYDLVNGIVSGHGDSGGPLWTYNGSTPTAVGIAVAGAPENFGIQFSAPDIGVIQGWLASAQCFTAGTGILTDNGEVLVEHLRIGDCLRTVLGNTTAPIVWIGSRHIDCLRHPNPKQVWPVRVAVDAFGPCQPRRDLFLSPDHAVLMNDVLIPIKHLINGTTIAQVSWTAVNYYHIELELHDVLLADGLPAESYLDTGDRDKFNNDGGTIRLAPDFSSYSPDSIAVREAFGCVSLMIAGPKVDAARRLLKSIASWMSQVTMPKVRVA